MLDTDGLHFVGLQVSDTLVELNASSSSSNTHTDSMSLSLQWPKTTSIHLVYNHGLNTTSNKAPTFNSPC